MEMVEIFLDECKRIWLYQNGTLLEYSGDSRQTLGELFNKHNWKFHSTSNRNYLRYVMPAVTPMMDFWVKPIDPILLSTITITFDLQKIMSVYFELIKKESEYPRNDSQKHLFVGKEDLAKIIQEKDLPENKFSLKFPMEYHIFEITLHFIPNLNESFLVAIP